MVRSPVRRPWAAAGYGLGATLSAAALLRAWRPERTNVDIAVTAATPWLLAPSWALLAGALVARRRKLCLLAGGLAAYHAACVRPRTGSAGDPHGAGAGDPDGAGAGAIGAGTTLRVAFANVWWLNPDVRGVLAELAAGEHDVVALAEVTVHHLAAIDDLLPASTYPWRALEPDQAPSKGLAIVSRVPLGDVEKWWSQGHPQLDVVVSPPGGAKIRLLVVHTWGPDKARHIGPWRAQFSEVMARAGSPARGQPTVLIGDYNATVQHRSFENLLKAGWRDAGTGGPTAWRPTWPDHRWWLPALFRLDHILVGPGIAVRARRTGRSRGSDHRPVSAVLVVPAGAG